MHLTIFGTPVINTLLRAGSIVFLKLAGWRIEGALPADAHKCVLIAAPHTSNWDLPYTLMTAFVLRLNVYWMGKASIFRPPFGPVMRWLGGIAVQRDQSNNLVAASAAALKAAHGTVQLIVPPEGTRIGGSHRQRLQRPGEQDHGSRHCRQRPYARHQAGEALGVFEPDRPTDLEQTGDDEEEPSHGGK